MKTNIEVITGDCELCGSKNDPVAMYVDQQNFMWCVVCPKCFYKRYGANDKLYYAKAINNVPNLLTYKEFKKHMKGSIVIGDAYPFFKEGGKFFSEMEKESAGKKVVDEFVNNCKIKNKFNIDNVQYKTVEQVSKGKGVVLIVGIRAYVRFKSYLEYMEHELYHAFRRDCPAIFQRL